MMSDIRSTRIGFTRLFLTSLFTIHWIAVNVQCQVTSGWGSGSHTTTDETTTDISNATSCETICTESYQECVSEICLCDDGFEYIDYHDCSRVCPNSCPINSECTNATYGCECSKGYENTTGTCKDIDECTFECNGTDRKCTNFPGYFSCECDDGYYSDGDDCIEASPECSASCGEHAACIDPDVGCQCVNGWSGEPTDCQDVDECSTECENAALICTNTQGSFYCSCMEGYRPIGGEPSAGCEPGKILRSIYLAKSKDVNVFFMLSVESCPEEKLSCAAVVDLCDSPDVVVFPATLFGYSSISTNSCAQSTTNSGLPYGVRFCSVSGSWAAPQWLSSCNEGLEELSTVSVETPEEREEVSSNLAILTSNPEKLDTNDIETTIAVIENVIAAETLDPMVTTSVISTISNIVESPSLADSGQTEELLSQLDDVASKVVLEDESYITVSNNVSMVITEAKESSSAGIGVALLERPDSLSMGFRADQVQLVDQSISSGNVLDKNMVQGSIYVPTSALNGGSRVAVYVFGNNNLFPASSKQSSSPEILSPNDTLVNGIVFSATVVGSVVTNLPDGDRLTFSTTIDNNTNEKKPLCAFWNEDVHAWSTAGCEVDFVQTTDVSIFCSCSHLTNFATLLDISGISDSGLDIITIVGCSISATALALTLAVFIFVPDMRKGRKFRPSFLLMNLSVSLLGLNITLIVSEMKFLTNPENVDSTKSSCIAVAVLLHLFLLCSWGWMNCEAANLYFAVQKPIYSRNEIRTSRVVLYSLLWGYLMPAVFVGITLIVSISVYDRQYEDEYKVTCWIAKDMVLYLAVIPIAIMLGFNLAVYGILTYSLCRNRQNSWGPTWRSNRSSMAKKLLVNACLVVIVGVTWIFGILLSAFSFDETTAKVFAYIFTILNSLQGVFIFLLYIVRSKEVRKNFRRKFFRLTEFSSSPTAPNTGQKGETSNRNANTIENVYAEKPSKTRSISQTEDMSLEN